MAGNDYSVLFRGVQGSSSFGEGHFIGLLNKKDQIDKMQIELTFSFSGQAPKRTNNILTFEPASGNLPLRGENYLDGECSAHIYIFLSCK